MAMNSLHSQVLDHLFRWWTLLGDGWVILALILIMLMIRMRIFLVMFAGYAISGLSAQLLKRIFFSDFARPVKYFELHDIGYNLHLVAGVDVHSWSSFPSGHTATAFGVFLSLSLFLRSVTGQMMAFILAVGVGYSRIYLSQHFLMDVTGGMGLGLCGGYLGWWWLNRYNNDWLDRSLPQLIKG